MSDFRVSPFTGNVFAGKSYAEQGRSLPAAREEKSISPEMAGWGRGEDMIDGGGAKLVSPYAQSAWVYVAISHLAEKVASIPFRISRMESGKARKVRSLRGSADPRHRAFVRKSLGETIIESGDVVDLFEQPHPTMNRQLFWEMVVTWNCLRGEFFILPLDGADGPVDLDMSKPNVERMITVPTELFWHVVVGYELQAWRYTGSPLLTPIAGSLLLPSEVLHSRSPNPYLFWRGMSPLLVAMVPAGADFAASKYNQGYWLNNADTGVIVTTEQQPDESQRKAILAALHERKRKAGTADRPLFLWGGAKVEKPMLSGMEAQMIENRKMNRQEILAVFKMTDSVIGLTDAKSSALTGGGNAINQEEVKFIESTVAPLCQRIETAVGRVVKTFGEGLVGWFDIEGLPIMQEARRQRVDSAVKMFGIGAAFNDINRVYDLGYPEYAWGGKSYIPFSLQEAGASPEMPGEEDAKAEEKGNPFERMQRLMSEVRGQRSEGRDQRSEVRGQEGKGLKELWESHINARRKTVKLMAGKVSKVLNVYRGIALQKLEKLSPELSKQMTVEGAWKGTVVNKSLVDMIFSAAEFGKDLLQELTVPIEATLQAAGDEMRKELGLDDPWKMAPEKAKEHILSRTLPIRKCGQTVRNQLNTALDEGFDAGESMKELGDRVREVFNTMSKGDAQRVARTETNIAYNTARQDAMKEAGIGYKAWLSSHGPHVRPAHAAAEATYTVADPIPVDEPFVVMGEELMFPGDDSMGASAENIINCQCIQLAAKPAEEKQKAESGKQKWVICGLGEMEFAWGAGN